MVATAARMIVAALLVLITVCCTSAFQVTNKQTKQSISWCSRLSASRSIGIFEDDDFSLQTGEWPYVDGDFMRVDASDDSRFYSEPRFVTHIDDRAIQSLTDFYRDEFKKGMDVLDLCSSWISHFPTDVKLGRVVGLGMNQAELEANKQLTEYVVQNLNKEPNLACFESDSFDVICNVVSVDYLTSPREIFQEMYRVLRPGGMALVSFSNRCFPTKAVAMWLQADDIERLTIVASYFYYSAQWSSIEALDIIPPPLERPERPSFAEMFNNPSAGFAWMNTAAAVAKSNAGDPMYVVKAIK